MFNDQKEYNEWYYFKHLTFQFVTYNKFLPVEENAQKLSYKQIVFLITFLIGD